MLTLALDTTAPAGSVAVCDGRRVLAELRGDASRPHGERLPSDVLRVLDRAERRLEAVDLFVVAAGPGAFTGLRIGIATIQGFAFALARPAAAVSALDAHASLLLAEGGCARDVLVGVWMDAARGEVFQALYEQDHDGKRLSPVGPATVGAPRELLAASAEARAGRPVCWTGSGAVRYRAELAADDPRSAIVEGLPPLARALAWKGLDAHEAGRSGLPHAIQPIYLRRPDAELARERRLSSRSV